MREMTFEDVDSFYELVQQAIGQSLTSNLTEDKIDTLCADAKHNIDDICNLIKQNVNTFANNISNVIHT
jgi:hypothetical protein